VTARTITNWIRAGLPQRDDGCFDTAQTDLWVNRKRGILPPAAAGLEPGAAATDKGKDFYDRENKRWQAKLKRLDFERRQGELIERAQLERERVARVVALKQALLTIPRSMAPILAATTEPREVERILERAISRAIERFSRPLNIEKAE